MFICLVVTIYKGNKHKLTTFYLRKNNRTPKLKLYTNGGFISGSILF